VLVFPLSATKTHPSLDVRNSLPGPWFRGFADERDWRQAFISGAIAVFDRASLRGDSAAYPSALPTAP
jgi:hypothetical protein